VGPRWIAISIVATPGRRRRALELAAQAERRGFGGLFSSSVAGEQLSFLVSAAHATESMLLATSIQPIYLRRPDDLAASAAYLAEVSGGRFLLGLGVSHTPFHRRLGVEAGPPLADMRRYVASLRSAEAATGPLPPIVLAALRDRMLDLAVEIADGAIWANAARSHMRAQLSRIPEDRLERGFLVANMIPTVVADDPAAAAAVHRRTLRPYLSLPNYRNYWKQAGYEEEMRAVEAALGAGDEERVAELMTSRWLADVTLSGSGAALREGIEAWQEAGVAVPVLVPSSTSGGQLRAVEELFAALA
jgi:probable F420-dependent oxidoreductase